MFDFSKYLNKDITEATLPKNAPEIQYHSMNRNWMSQNPPEIDGISAIMSLTENEVITYWNNVKDSPAIVNGVNEELSSYKFKHNNETVTIKGFVDDLIEYKKVFFKNFRTREINSFSVAKVIVNFFINKSSDFEFDQSIASDDYATLLSAVKNDSFASQVIDSGEALKIKDFIGYKSSTDENEQDVIQEVRDLYVAFIAAKKFYSDVASIVPQGVALRTPIKVLNIMLNIKIKGLSDASDFPAGLVSTFFEKPVVESINKFEKNLHESSSYIEHLYQQIKKFIDVVKISEMPQGEMKTNEDVEQAQVDNKLFLGTTYNTVNQMTNIIAETNNFLIASKQAAASSSEAAYKLLSVQAKPGIISFIVRGFLRVNGFNVRSALEKKKADQTEGADALMNKAKMFDTMFQSYFISLVNKLYSLMISIFSSESQRQPSLNAIKAWKILSQFDEFFVESEKWLKSIDISAEEKSRTEETINKAREQEEKIKDLEQQNKNYKEQNADLNNQNTDLNNQNADLKSQVGSFEAKDKKRKSVEQERKKKRFSSYLSRLVNDKDAIDLLSRLPSYENDVGYRKALKQYLQGRPDAKNLAKIVDESYTFSKYLSILLG